MAISMKSYMQDQDMHMVFSVGAKSLKCFNYGGQVLWNAQVTWDPASTLARPKICMNRGSVAALIEGPSSSTPPFVELSPPNSTGEKFSRVMGTTYGAGTTKGDVQFHGPQGPGGHTKKFASAPDVPYAGYVLTDPEMQRLAQTIRGCWQKAGTVYCTVAE